MFWLFVCLTAAGAFGAGMAFAQVRLRTSPDAPGDAPVTIKGALPAPRRPATGDVMEELFSVQRGDVVVHMQVDHLVGRVEQLDADGHTVVRADMENPEGVVLWMTDHPTVQAMLARRAAAHAITEHPPTTLQHGGYVWRRVRRMEAHPKGGRALQIHLYEGPDGLSLWALVSDGEVEVFEGRAMQPASTMVLKA